MYEFCARQTQAIGMGCGVAAPHPCRAARFGHDRISCFFRSFSPRWGENDLKGKNEGTHFAATISTPHCGGESRYRSPVSWQSAWRNTNMICAAPGVTCTSMKGNEYEAPPVYLHSA